MNNHQKRLLIAGGIAIGVLTALFILLDKTPVAITAYCFSLLAPAVICAMLWKVAAGSRKDYITNAAFPLQMYSYCIINLLINGIFVLLDQTGIWSIHAGWLVFIHILLIAFFAWRFLAMDAGQEEIRRVEKSIQIKRVNWKMIAADVAALKNDSPDPCRKDLQDVIDAINYADPVTCDELLTLDEQIKDNVSLLELKLREENPGEVSLICLKIQRQIKDRNTRAKLLK
ncbi:MAG: hypothetical protein IKC82_03405 [Lentisphaeria bacterium]|nr:hypothetical protein [Lentisphaeria bacterium]